MAHMDWTKIQQALQSHELIGVLLIAWSLSVALYVLLQIWFALAWAGRWRIAALIPLIAVVVLTLIFFLGQSYDPDLFGPPAAGVFENLIVAGVLVSPPGFIYLVIAGIAHRARSRSAAS